MSALPPPWGRSTVCFPYDGSSPAGTKRTKEEVPCFLGPRAVPVEGHSRCPPWTLMHVVHFAQRDHVLAAVRLRRRDHVRILPREGGAGQVERPHLTTLMEPTSDRSTDVPGGPWNQRRNSSSARSASKKGRLCCPHAGRWV